MGLILKHVRVYICDRCADTAEVEGTEPMPTGWTRVVYGGSADDDTRNTTIWLCADCTGWLRKFLSGRKVAD